MSATAGDAPLAPLTERRLDYMPLSDLRPNPANPRKHKPAELRKSFNRFGYTNPIHLDERTGLIAAGHGRHALLVQMKGDKATPPEAITVREDGEWLVPVSRGWASKDDDEAMAYLIADNRQTERGGWIEPELAAMLTEVRETDLSLAGTGFTPKDVDALLADPAAEPETGIENDYGQRADLYRNKQVRSIIFDYPLADYEYVTTQAHAARRRHGAETNAELFILLLRAWDADHPLPA